MRILTMGRIVRPVTLALLPFFLLFLLDVRLAAQDRAAGQGRIENARWELVGGVVVITYDLLGDARLTYDVRITLTRTGDKDFKIAPVSVTGAIGKGKYAGVKMVIRWDYKKDVPQGLSGDDYAFEFDIQIVKEEGGSNLLLYLAGGLAVVGGAAALLLGGGKAASTTASPSGLPSPPTVRPTSQ
jgi:hypothetical protein